SPQIPYFMVERRPFGSSIAGLFWMPRDANQALVPRHFVGNPAGRGRRALPPPARVEGRRGLRDTGRAAARGRAATETARIRGRGRVRIRRRRGKETRRAGEE